MWKEFYNHNCYGGGTCQFNDEKSSTNAFKLAIAQVQKLSQRQTF